MPIGINGNGTITGVTVGGLPDGIVDTDMLAANAVSSAKLASGVGGKFLQVVQAVKSDTQTFTATSFSDITGLSASITPTSSSNKILVEASVFASTGNNVISLNLVRGSTNIAQPSGSSSNNAITHSYVAYDSMHSMNFSFLDSPNTTNSTTYKIQVKGILTSIIAINRYNVSDDYHAISTLTLMEVAA